MIEQQKKYAQALQAEKNQLRKICRAKQALLPARGQKEGAFFAQTIQALEVYRKAQIIFCFVSIAKEPDTRVFLQEALAQGKTLCVPWCAGYGVMQAKEITALSQLEAGVYGIPAPPATLPTVPAEEIDLALVPCIVADRLGARLGQGGGYYDRFLPLLAATATAIVLCQKAMVVPQGQIPTGPRDIFIPYVLTEQGWASAQQPG